MNTRTALGKARDTTRTFAPNSMTVIRIDLAQFYSSGETGFQWAYLGENGRNKLSLGKLRESFTARNALPKDLWVIEGSPHGALLRRNHVAAREVHCDSIPCRSGI